MVGAKLPASYVDFLRFSNGGFPQVGTFYIEHDGYREDWSVNNLFPASSDPDSTETLEWNHSHQWPGIPSTVLPIARDAFGNLFCLDLSESGKGSVILLTHGDPARPWTKIFDSFEEFINSLEQSPDD